MPEIQEILPPHAVASLPHSDWEYLAEKLWAHSQHFINTGAHIFSGGVIVYDKNTNEATVKLDSLTHPSIGASSIIELIISYDDKGAMALKKLVIPKDHTAFSERQVEDWSFNAGRTYIPDIESEPFSASLRIALERLSTHDQNSPEQKFAILNELNDFAYFHEYISEYAQKHRNDADAWKRLQFVFSKSGIIDLVSDYVDVTESPESYDRLQAMDWLYNLYDRQTPNKPYMLVNEHDQYILLHVDENKDNRLPGTKVEFYTGDLVNTPIEVGVEIYHALPKVKRQRTLANFMTTNEEQTYSQGLSFDNTDSEDRVQRPSWGMLSSATTWRPATEIDMAKWLSLTPPPALPRDGNDQNLLDMYNSAKETLLKSWLDYPAGLAASQTADTLYNPEDADRTEYLATQLQMSVGALPIDNVELNHSPN